MRTVLDSARYRPENFSSGSIPIWQPRDTERFRPIGETSAISRGLVSGAVRFIGSNEDADETVDAIAAHVEMETKFCKKHIRPKTKRTGKRKNPGNEGWWTYERRLAAAERMRERMTGRKWTEEQRAARKAFYDNRRAEGGS